MIIDTKPINSTIFFWIPLQSVIGPCGFSPSSCFQNLKYKGVCFENPQPMFHKRIIHLSFWIKIKIDN